MAFEYKDVIEDLLSKPNLVIRKDGTLNKQEPTIKIDDPESLGIIAFENNLLYEDNHFISGYCISEEAFNKFEKTGQIELSQEERANLINQAQKNKILVERNYVTKSLFSKGLPPSACIGNKQLREVEILQKLLKLDPNILLTEKEQNMIKRA